VRRVSSYDPGAPRPDVGSSWLWEPDRPHAYSVIEVLEVKWNGEEWWVRTSGGDRGYWNDLGRFWEAVKPDTPRRRAAADARKLAARTLPEADR
jgi:hypothetical protein